MTGWLLRLTPSLSHHGRPWSHGSISEKKCGIRCTLLLPPGGLFNCGFLWGRTLHAQRLNQFSGQRFAFQNIRKSEKLSTFTRVDLYDTRSPPPPRRHYWPLSEMVLVSRWHCCCFYWPWPIPTHRTAPQSSQQREARRLYNWPCSSVAIRLCDKLFFFFHLPRLTRLVFTTSTTISIFTHNIHGYSLLLLLLLVVGSKICTAENTAFW